MILLDTNILLRYARIADSDFAKVDIAVNTLHANGDVLCVVPQNVYEFWAAATRPTAANGLALSVPECQVQLARIKRLFLLPDLPTLDDQGSLNLFGHSGKSRIQTGPREEYL